MRDTLLRYPMTSRICFIECGGNSAPLLSPQPVPGGLQALHGLVSCAEWTDVRLSTLLEEVGVDRRAKWFVAEGADPPHLMRSVPLAKGLNDAMIALYRRRTANARQWLSDAPSAARIRGQHERQVCGLRFPERTPSK